MTRSSTQVVIVGAGLAGLTAAVELLDQGKQVVLLDRNSAAQRGGLAKQSFGGIFLVGTPQQRLLGIKDSPDLAWRDWQATAEFGTTDHWPRRWAEQYVNSCHDEVYRWLRRLGVGFFPIVHWVERGLFRPGNSVPRFHMVWGAGHGLVERVLERLEQHPKAQNHSTLFGLRVTDFTTDNGRVNGVTGVDEGTGRPFEIHAECVVVASGGICGDIPLVKQHWHKAWGEPPETILNGAHPSADGTVHRAAAAINAEITHLDRMWLYAAGVHHPTPHFPGQGLSLVPPKSALWVNYRGERFGPMPLIGGYDTRYIVEQVCRQPVKHSWQIMNQKIAIKELAVSGVEFNDALRDRKLFSFLKSLLRGNKKLVDTLAAHCPDFVVADTVDELVDKMNGVSGTAHVDAAMLRQSIMGYDEQIARGPHFHNDEQLRRLAHLRQYRGDRVRTCAFQRILDPKAGPLIAVREFLLSRKSLGGIVTDLQCRVLQAPDRYGHAAAIDGLYAIGEAAGFGGGGIHGKASLEGTFLGSCILTGRMAAQHIATEVGGRAVWSAQRAAA